jgi:hypothetical protein
MKAIFLRLTVLLALGPVCVDGQTNGSPGIGFPRTTTTARTSLAPASIGRGEALAFTTPAYREEAVRMLIQEANTVARELRLPETLPITRTNVLAAYISPPGLVRINQSVGNITTSNFTYYVSVASKFSFLERTDLQRERDQLEAQYLWPVARMDTNAAYRLATQFLAAASMDVGAISRDCIAHILPLLPDQADGAHFVPIYWVYWERKGAEGRGGVAEVELFEPTMSLRQMRVTRAEYILRKPVVIQNVDDLLSRTNAPSR